MKNKLSISIIFLIVFCYCSNNSSELPTRKQKNWCISNADIVQRTSEINENQKIILKDLYEAEQIYFKSTGIEVSFFQFQNLTPRKIISIFKIIKNIFYN